MALDDVYQVTMTAQATGGYYQNSIAVRVIEAAEPTAADFGALAADWLTIWRQEQHTSIFWRSWRARQVRGSNVVYPSGADCQPVGGNLFEGNITTGNQGGEATEMLPPQCALVITFKTNQIGRRARGRAYGFGWTEAQQGAGVWTTPFQTLIQGRLNTFMTKYAPATLPIRLSMGIWSYRTATGCEVDPATHKHVRRDAPNPAAAFTAVNSALLRPTVYTQRRRVAGVGR
jgi:hypothetical protein